MSTKFNAINKKNEDYEIIEFTENESINNIVSRIHNELTNASPTKQMIIGGFSGYFTGYTLAKVSRAFLAILGGSLIVIHFANQQGYIKIDWNKMKTSVKKLRNGVGEHEHRDIETFFNKSVNILKQNISFTGSFFGGFLIGLSF